MQQALRSIAISLFVFLCAIQLQAAPDTSSCIGIQDATVTCEGIDNQGRVKYKVHFKFSYVKPGTNFIRIHEGSDQGTTHTYPFQQNRQNVSGRMYWWEFPYRCFTIDVYDVLPNGKVVMCSVMYCVWVPCGGGQGEGGILVKDVVAGESLAAPSMTLAPNPAMDEVSVALSVPTFDPASSVEVVDMNGNVVATLASGMPSGDMVIPAQLNLPSGMYMVRLVHAGGMLVQPLQLVK